MRRNRSGVDAAHLRPVKEVVNDDTNRKKLKSTQIGDASTIGLLEAGERANQILGGDVVLPTAEAPKSPSPSESPPSLKTTCADYIARMKKRRQLSHTEYQKALIDRDYSFCKFMEENLGRPAIAS